MYNKLPATKINKQTDTEKEIDKVTDYHIRASLLHTRIYTTGVFSYSFITLLKTQRAPKQKINCKKQFMIGLQGYLEICGGDL